MVDDFLLGRYVERDSIIHRLDARTKLLLCLIAMVPLFIASRFASLGICALAIGICYLLSRVPARNALIAFAPLSLLVIFTFILNLFFVQGGPVYFHWLIFTISEAGLNQALFFGARLSLLLLLACLLTLTTSNLDICDAFEKLLSPFTRIGLPAHELSMIMSLTLRFLPQFIKELQNAYRAQVSRGASLSRGRIKMLASLVIPLFTASFRKAETLSDAMDSRCYHGGFNRTRLEPLAFHLCDFFALLCVLALYLAVFICNSAV